ncbi:MAG: hypothetical protein WAM39_02335 [Bryobacteraceae bacterium]
MTHHHLKALLFLIVVVLTPARTFADGGNVQMRKEAGGLIITVFTSPAPLAAGQVDLSVLVQNRDGLEPVLDADPSVLLRRDASSTEIRARATREQAQNKLLYAAPLTLTQSGRWHVSVTARHKGSRAEIAGEIEVPPGRMMARFYLGYIAFPPLVITVFLTREWLIRRKANLRVSRCEIT